MSRIEEIKKRKPFALWDLLIYGILIAVILLLFGIFVFSGSGKAASGIQIMNFNGKVIYTYEYAAGKGEITEEWKERIEEKEEDGVLYVTVYHDDAKEEFNILAIDLNKKTAVMHDANCSFRKDCTKMNKITSERNVILCIPYNLKICALGGEKEDLSKPSLG